MTNTGIKKILKNEIAVNIAILTGSIVFIYLLVSLYFTNHFFFRTIINDADVSLKSYSDAKSIFQNYVRNYRLRLAGRNSETEEITGQDIGMRYNEKSSIVKVFDSQKPFKWIGSLINGQTYQITDLYTYNAENLLSRIDGLDCLNKEITEPQDAGFKYSDGKYEVIEEIYGNKINKEKLIQAVKISILKGKTKLDLNESRCYEEPKYTAASEKVLAAKDLLNKYVSAKINYIFRKNKETLDGETINKWLNVDENMEPVIDENAVKQYVQGLSRKYDTAGKTRKFKTSAGKEIEVKGGFYGWKINQKAEMRKLLMNIRLGESVEREPVYSQRTFAEEEDEIGDTYVEINITRQYLWFYKDGRIIAQGPVVTGNPSKGHSTGLGTYMLNYKQEKGILRGPGYEAEVKYWMPFNGNQGIHDASWRHSFGGNIYKTRGSHGCVNAPEYLAKKIFENIEPGVPIICYEM